MICRQPRLRGSAGTLRARQQVARWSSARRPGPRPGPSPGDGAGGECICCFPGVSWLPDDATWALSGFARIPWLEVGVQYLGVGSLGARGWSQADLDHVGRSGYETAWATPGHDCLCSHASVRPQPNPSVSGEAAKLWRRVASFSDTLVCKEGGGAHRGEPQPVRWELITYPVALR